MRWLAVFLLLTQSAVAAEPSGGGARWARGEIAARVLDEGTVLGSERWDLTVHPDGSRTMNTSYALAKSLRTAVLRVDESFQPRELFTQYWTDGVFRNAAFVVVRGPLLDVTSRQGQNTTHTFVSTPQRFAFVAHPVATDVWQLALYDKAGSSPQSIPVFVLDTTLRDERPFGVSAHRQVTYIGLESVNVPAGTFTCDHYRIGEDTYVWVYGPDALPIRAMSTATKTEFVLMKLEQSAVPESVPPESAPPDGGGDHSAAAEPTSR